MTKLLFTVLKGWQCVEMQGADAQDYLQRLSTADFRNLRPGQFTAATLLNATGKITFYFKALCLEPQKYLILAPAQEPAAHDALERMHFRENFALKDLGDQWAYVRVIGTDPAALERFEALKRAQAAERGAIVMAPGMISICEQKWSVDPIRFDFGVLVERPQLERFKSELVAAGFTEQADLEAYRLRAADPAVPSELSTNTIPLEAKLEDAVHENKGCYPGQEVIERIRSMGQVPRQLARLRGQGQPPVATAELRSGDQVAGHVTSSAIDPVAGGWVALGYVKRVFAKETAGFTIAGTSVDVQY